MRSTRHTTFLLPCTDRGQRPRGRSEQMGWTSHKYARMPKARASYHPRYAGVGRTPAGLPKHTARHGGQLSEWSAKAMAHTMPRYTDTHGTVLRRFAKLYASARLEQPMLPRGLPKTPGRELQLAFVGFLLAEDKVGGTTIADCVRRLPTALALHHSNFTSGYKQFNLHPEVAAAVSSIAVDLPAKRVLPRDPADINVISLAYSDKDTPFEVRAAIVLNYYLGFRSINMFSTKRGRSFHAKTNQRRDLLWKDVRAVACNGVRGYEVIVRMEKTATTHSGSFAPKLLMPSLDELPCPVAVVDALAQLHGTEPDTPILPGVTASRVQRALQKHAEEGRRLTAYSLRIGATTDKATANLPMHVQRHSGNWASNTTADKYVRNTKQEWERVQKSLRKLRRVEQTGQSQQQTIPETLPPRPTDSLHGAVRSYPDGRTSIL